MFWNKLHSAYANILILIGFVQPLSAINTSIGSIVPSEMEQFENGGVWEGAVHFNPQLLISSNSEIIDDEWIAAIKLERPFFTTETDQINFDRSTSGNEPWDANRIRRFTDNQTEVRCGNLFVKIRANEWKAASPTLWRQDAFPTPDRLGTDDIDTEIDETNPGLCIDPTHLNSQNASDAYDIHRYHQEIPITTSWSPVIQESNMRWADMININAGLTLDIPADAWLETGGRKAPIAGGLGKPEDFEFHDKNLEEFRTQVKSMFHSQKSGIRAVYFKMTGRDGHTKENILSAANHMVLSQGLAVDQFIVCNDEPENYTGNFAKDFQQVAQTLQLLPQNYTIPRIEAENYSAKSKNRESDNIQLIETFGMGYILNGDWLRYDNVDFGSGVNQLKVRYGSAGSGGNLRIRTGGPDGAILASVSLPPTGEWFCPEEQTATISDLSGVQTIWMTFDGPIHQVLFALERFEFDRVATDVSGNFARGKPATHSSQLHPEAAKRAVDGNTNGDAESGSVAVTEVVTEETPWWEVDLEANYPIGEIKIWNRTDCCSDLLEDYTVIILDRNDDIIWYKHCEGTTSSPTSVISGGIEGRKVRIQLNESKTLNLAEVELFAEVPAIPLDQISSPDQNRLPRLEAEYPNATSGDLRSYRFNEISGLGFIRPSIPETSYRIYNIYDSNWIRFDNVDFGDGVSQIWARYVTRHDDRGGGLLRVRTLSKTGPIHSTVVLPLTGGREFVRDASAAVTGLKGVNTVWITFEGIEVPLFELDWIEFDS